MQTKQLEKLLNKARDEKKPIAAHLAEGAEQAARDNAERPSSPANTDKREDR